MKYKAFMSYSHKADEILAADVQSALHKFAKKWRHFRAIRTFRDTTNLSVTPALWYSITNAIDESEFFILMASPQAARSPWVDREVAYWLQTRTAEAAAEKLLIVLTSGRILWNNDPDSPDFDWDRTDTLPPSLKGVFRQEPRFADLSWIITKEDRSLRNPRFRAAIADLAAPLHGKDKDDLDGEDIRQYRKAAHFRQFIFTTLVVLLIVSVATAAYALKQSRLARRNAREAQESQRRAEANELLARQRQAEAEESAREANRQARRADDERANAERQTGIANDQRRVAEQQQKIATTNAELAEKRQQEAVAQTALARHKNYLASVAYVMAADENTRVSESPQIKARLDSLDKSLRSWEWQHLRLKMDSSTLTIDGGKVFSQVVDVAYSPDGSRIAAATSDGLVRVLEARTGKPLLTLSLSDGTKGRVSSQSIAYSPDGSRIAAGGPRGILQVWDAITGAKQLDLRYEDGESAHGFDIASAAFSSDGTKIMALTFMGFRAWDSKTGARLHAAGSSRDQTSGVVAFSPDGSRLVRSDSEKGTLMLTDTDAGRPVVTLEGADSSSRSNAFSDDGSIYAAAAEDSIKVWDAQTGKLKFTLSGHRTRVQSLSFSPSGKRLASCSYEGVRVWSLESGTQITLMQGHQRAVNTVDFGPDDNLVVSGAEDSTLRTWNVPATAHISLPQPNVIRSLAVSRDGKYIAAGERPFGQDSPRVLIYESATLTLARILTPLVADITALDFSADGRRLVVAGANGLARVFDANSGDLQGTIKGNHLINAVAFSADGKYLAFGARDGHVAVWTVGDLKPAWEATDHKDIVDQLNFSPDSTRLVSGSWDKTIKVWEAATGKNLKTLGGHESAVFSVSFSPDGKRISSGSFDRTIRIWDASKGDLLDVLPGHTNGVTSTKFSLDGRRIFSASADTSLRLWDAQAKEFITVLRDVTPLRDWVMEGANISAGTRIANYGIQSLVLSPDGARLLAAVTERPRVGSTRSYLMIWNSSPHTHRGDVTGMSLAGLPRVAAAASPAPAGNVVHVHLPPQQSEAARWLERSTAPGIPVLDLVRRARYRGSREEVWEHELRYETPIDLEGNSARAYITRGSAYSDREDHDAAIFDFTTALKLEPNNAEAFGMRGVAHYFNHDAEEAVSDLSNAIELRAENLGDYHLLRGNIYVQWKQYDLALPDLDRAVELSPRSGLAFAERGRLYLKMGQYDRAAADFGRAIEADPENPKFYNERGEAMYRKGDLASAAKEFEEAIRKSKGFIPSHFNLACVLFDLGRYDESLRRWRALRQIAPQMGSALAGEAITLNAQGKGEEAFNKFVAAVNEDTRFLNCDYEFNDSYFWAESGCRAAASLIERLRAKLLEYKMKQLKEAKTN